MFTLTTGLGHFVIQVLLRMIACVHVCFLSSHYWQFIHADLE